MVYDEREEGRKPDEPPPDGETWIVAITVIDCVVLLVVTYLVLSAAGR